MERQSWRVRCREFYKGVHFSGSFPRCTDIEHWLKLHHFIEAFKSRHFDENKQQVVLVYLLLPNHHHLLVTSVIVQVFLDRLEKIHLIRWDADPNPVVDIIDNSQSSK